MKRYFSLLAVIFFLTTCTTFRLKNHLPSDIKQWFENHYELMEAKLPAWVDESSPHEWKHFLNLSEKLQRKYMKVFWEMRHEGARENYYSRIVLANSIFRSEGILGHLTDRGRVFVLCGNPSSIQWYRNDRLDLLQNCVAREGDVCVWNYFIPGFGKASYVFKYVHNNYWKLDMQASDYVLFEKNVKKLFAPTEEGYDLWASELLSYLKDKEKMAKVQKNKKN